MPIREYLCPEGHTTERLELRPHAPTDPSLTCATCGKNSLTLTLSAPSSIRMADMSVLTKKRQRIKEPIWRYPDGSYESVHA